MKKHYRIVKVSNERSINLYRVQKRILFTWHDVDINGFVYFPIINLVGLDDIYAEDCLFETTSASSARDFIYSIKSMTENAEKRLHNCIITTTLIVVAHIEI